jgi:hypothetical protein
MSCRNVCISRAWKSEAIDASDPLARFAAMAQKVLVKRMIAANRTHAQRCNALAASRLARRTGGGGCVAPIAVIERLRA